MKVQSERFHNPLLVNVMSTRTLLYSVDTPKQAVMRLSASAALIGGVLLFP